MAFPPSAPPPRPGTSVSTPAPIRVVTPQPRAVSSAKALWLLSFAAGIAVLVGSFLTRDSHLERLRTVVDEMSPGGEAEALATSSGIIFWGSIGAGVLVILLEAAALAIVLGKRGWARWLLILLMPGHVLAVAVTAAFLVPGGDSGNHVLGLWGAQLLLALSGLILLFTPSARTWLKQAA